MVDTSSKCRYGAFSIQQSLTLKVISNVKSGIRTHTKKKQHRLIAGFMYIRSGGHSHRKLTTRDTRAFGEGERVCVFSVTKEKKGNILAPRDITDMTEIAQAIEDSN